MKKLLAALSLVGVLSLPAFAFASTYSFAGVGTSGANELYYLSGGMPAGTHDFSMPNGITSFSNDQGAVGTVTPLGGSNYGAGDRHDQLDCSIRI